MLPIRVSVFLAALAVLAPAAEKVVIYDLPSALNENGEPGGFSLLSPKIEAGRPLTFCDLSTSMAAMAADPEVRAVVVEADRADLELAQVLELRRHLGAARRAGKDVWVYSDTYANKSALLGSVANRFFLMPVADADFSGLDSTSLYFKGLLEKAGIRADVVHIGNFKSFGEQYYREGPSEYSQLQTDQMMDGLFRVIHTRVAEGRGIADETVLDFINRGTFTAREALAAGLCDGLAYRSEFSRRIREAYPGAQMDKSYRLSNPGEIKVQGAADLAKLLLKSLREEPRRQDYIAVVPFEGAITEDSIATARTEILKLTGDKHAKALVLRVNSPGGSASASEILWEATRQWRETGRPFAVSMGGVAASGGYYISCGADRIFAEEGTITGSIGVVGMKFVIGGALEKLGVTVHTTKRGEFADALSMAQPFTPEQSELLRKSMLHVYDTFKQRILDGRGSRLTQDLESIAGGRVYVGNHALELGLVDEIGGVVEAVRWVSARAGVPNASAILTPPPKSLLEELIKIESGSDDDSGDLVGMQAARHPVAEALQAYFQTLRPGALPVAAQRLLTRGLEHIAAASESPIQLIGPDIQLQW